MKQSDVHEIRRFIEAAIQYLNAAMSDIDDSEFALDAENKMGTAEAYLRQALELLGDT